MDNGDEIILLIVLTLHVGDKDGDGSVVRVGVGGDGTGRDAVVLGVIVLGAIA